MKLGTGLSIMISKRNPSLVTTFGLLSCGYIFSSYQEVNWFVFFHFLFLLIMEFLLVILLYICNIFQVRSVVLHTLNRARFNVAVETFLKTGALSVIWYFIKSLEKERCSQSLNYFSIGLNCSQKNKSTFIIIILFI